MAYNGYKAAIKTSGTPVTLTAAATTKLTGAGITVNTQYQITNAAQRILAPFEPVTVLVGGSAVSATLYTLDRLQGKVIFYAARDAGDVITITGKYLPMSMIAEAYEFTYTLEGSNEAKPTFASSWEKRWQASKDFSAELSEWYDTSFNTFKSALDTGNIMVLEFIPDNGLGTVDLRAWVLVGSQEVSGSAGGLLEEAIEFNGTTDNEGRTVSV